MIVHDLRAGLHDLQFTSGVNILYHQSYERWYRRWDRAFRLAVAVSAIASLCLTVKDVPPWGLILGIATALLAAFLGIYTLGDWEKQHGNLFRLWSSLREEIERASHRCQLLDDSDDVAHHDAERLEDLAGKAAVLHGYDTAPNKSFLIECHEAETEALWGTGIRTPEEVEKERHRRLTLA